MAVSAISLKLDDSYARTPAQWAAIGLAALDCGMNCFEIAGRSPSLVDGLGQALRTVERRLIYVILRAGPCSMPSSNAGAAAFTPAALTGQAMAVVARTGLDYLDLIQLDDPGQQDLSAEALQALKQAKTEGLVNALGVAGEGPEIDAYISTGAFDVLTMPFNMLSGSRERRRMRAAGERNMSVLGGASYPEAMLVVAEASAPKKNLLGWPRRNEGASSAPYGFLHATPDWTVEEICLAFALTEPSLASVQVTPRDIAHLQALAAVAERELPAGLPAQIEMSHFAALGKDKTRA
jgi:aryl-alcohol dehydrogenase-like predicted oxidoreductase